MHLTNKYLKHKIKELTLKIIIISLSLLKGFMRFFNGGSCGLLLETRHLDDLPFVSFDGFICIYLLCICCFYSILTFDL
jgi:hypothetical protein